MVAEIREGIYKALNTDVEFVAGQVKEPLHRPSIKVIVTPQSAKADNPYIYFVTYRLAVSWFTTSYTDFEDEGQELLEYMFDRLTKDIKIKANGKTNYISIDGLTGDLYEGVAVITGAISVDIRRDPSEDANAQGELMEELSLDLEDEQ